MTDGISDWLDIVILVLVMGAGIVTGFMPLAQEWNRPIMSVVEDKTMVLTSNLFDASSVQTGKDVLGILIVADQFMTSPRALKINDSPVLVIDETWVANRDSNIRQLYDIAGTVKLGAMLNWKVISITYVEDVTPYWHFKLEEV